MKNTLLAITAALAFCACDDIGDDRIYDYFPVDFAIIVSDQQGNDLLDINQEGNILDDISIVYDGKTYTYWDQMGEQNGHAGNKALPAKWFGLRLQHNSQISRDSTDFMPYYSKRDVDNYYLVFGQWDGGYNHNFSFIVKWNGQEEKITYRRKVNNGDVSSKWTHNGKKITPTLYLVK